MCHCFSRYKIKLSIITFAEPKSQTGDIGAREGVIAKRSRQPRQGDVA